MDNQKPYTLYGKLYGILVLHGRRALDAEENPDNLPVVPEKFVEQVLAYLDYVAKKTQKD